MKISAVLLRHWIHLQQKQIGKASMRLKDERIDKYPISYLPFLRNIMNSTTEMQNHQND